ncbi:ornithine decarboxylase antizyme [Arctopsyche grandis]|uniref:ornithine decarboxylase antizyme n=1 Tax=Arctopsyche grandis TaxID=121162 RepID=UPI00406D85AF
MPTNVSCDLAHVFLSSSSDSQQSSFMMGGNKRSAASAGAAECFSVCLGAGPLWWLTPPPLDHHPWNAAAWNSEEAAASTPSTPETLISPLASDADAIQYREEVITKIVELKDVKPVKINFSIYLTETTHSLWETVLHDKTLYMTVPPVLSNGSKESFITLLEFAEERLGCSRCVLCVRKSRPDRAALLRAFMFMGFQLLGPDGLGASAPTDRPDYLYMVYVME